MKWKPISEEEIKSIKERRESDACKYCEAVMKIATSRTHLVSEMACFLQDYMIKVDGIQFQLIENWCLCKYCQRYNPQHDDFNHWKEELTANIKFIKSPTIKGKIDKKKTLVRMLVKDYDYNQAAKVCEVILEKFHKEKIFDEVKIQTVAQDFANNIYGLIDVISSTETDATEKYLLTFNPPQNPPKK